VKGGKDPIPEDYFVKFRYIEHKKSVMFMILGHNSQHA